MSTRSSLCYWYDENVGQMHVWEDFLEPEGTVFIEILPFDATMFMAVLTREQWKILKGRLNPEYVVE